MDYKGIFNVAQQKGYKPFHSINRLLSKPLIYEKLLYMELCLIQKWFRDDLKIEIIISKHFETSYPECWGYQINPIHGYRIFNECWTYEEALIEGIYQGLKLI
jgi:hypothetical protein